MNPYIWKIRSVQQPFAVKDEFESTYANNWQTYSGSFNLKPKAHFYGAYGFWWHEEENAYISHMSSKRAEF